MPLGDVGFEEYTVGKQAVRIDLRKHVVLAKDDSVRMPEGLYLGVP